MKISTESTEIGNVEVYFSNRTKTFELHWVDDAIPKKCTNIHYQGFKTWDDVTKAIKTTVEEFNYVERFVGKFIYIQMKTSSSDWINNKNGIMQEKQPELLYDGQGFSLKWYVLEKYQAYNPDPMVMGSKSAKFKIIESGKGCKSPIVGSYNIEGQLFHSDFYRKLPYTDEIYNFLKSLEISIDEMSQKICTFFDTDENNFLLNVQSTQLLLDKPI